MRKNIVAGNWKMNLSIAEASDLVETIVDTAPAIRENQVVVFCTPFTHLQAIAKIISTKGHPQFTLGAQNCSDQLAGAFTGEISVKMLKEIGVSYVIIGHSERRQLFGESNDFLKKKVDTLIAENMQVLFCCGEPLEIRNAGEQNDYVGKQLSESLFHLNADQMKNYITIAYEPIWAIGTGVTASTQQAQEMHAYIRSLLSEKYDSQLAADISILYGGSCNAQNAQDLFANEDVDGGLIGGAALKAETFLPIVSAMN
jgi:triosephosphate isomerase